MSRFSDKRAALAEAGGDDDAVDPRLAEIEARLNGESGGAEGDPAAAEGADDPAAATGVSDDAGDGSGDDAGLPAEGGDGDPEAGSGDPEDDDGNGDGDNDNPETGDIPPGAARRRFSERNVGNSPLPERIGKAVADNENDEQQGDGYTVVQAEEFLAHQEASISKAVEEAVAAQFSQLGIGALIQSEVKKAVSTAGLSAAIKKSVELALTPAIELVKANSTLLEQFADHYDERTDEVNSTVGAITKAVEGLPGVVTLVKGLTPGAAGVVPAAQPTAASGGATAIEKSVVLPPTPEQNAAAGKLIVEGQKLQEQLNKSVPGLTDAIMEIQGSGAVAPATLTQLTKSVELLRTEAAAAA